ncbi:hypothetical protein CA13_08820 [Planctomycetes bacterium CA13]|uniref:Uncharacterized protein n=1 Tax=Novipirellula herctigrandis TaxID=2527986 RepID=A0A5C5YXR0_9BACT|nr:hypothetical protein CA13_08820 [Planctomycetes bacterium CA13]
MKCGTVSVSSVKWSDTGEVVSDFRAGLRDAIRESSPEWVQKLPVTLAIAFLILFGFGGALAVAGGRDFLLPIMVGAIFGVVGLAIGFGLGFISRGAKRVKVMSDQMGIDARHLTRIERIEPEQ